MRAGLIIPAHHNTVTVSFDALVALKFHGGRDGA